MFLKRLFGKDRTSGAQPHQPLSNVPHATALNTPLTAETLSQLMDHICFDQSGTTDENRGLMREATHDAIAAALPPDMPAKDGAAHLIESCFKLFTNYIEMKKGNNEERPNVEAYAYSRSRFDLLETIDKNLSSLRHRPEEELIRKNISSVAMDLIHVQMRYKNTENAGEKVSAIEESCVSGIALPVLCTIRTILKATTTVSPQQPLQTITSRSTDLTL